MDHPAYRLELLEATPAGRVRVLRHRSGARIVQRDDGRPEHAFAIGFPAPVPDDSGVAHVLEHLIFRGSVRYPDDQLYTALRSNSVASHLNATTGAEMTAYHMASPLPVDALRLQEALLDAIFHPLLTDVAFAQEAFDPANGTPGVVMNEMRGHLAEPPARADHALRRALYPDHAMGRCYGGDPAAIAPLSLAQVKAFHRRHYHPAKALVLLSGRGDAADSLALLDRAFAAVSAQNLPAQDKPPLHAPMAAAIGPAMVGWGLPPPCDHWHGMVLAELVMENVGRARLTPASGYVSGRDAFLALFGAGAGQVDLAELAADLTPERAHRAALRLRAKITDPEDNLRLPAGLFDWPGLCAAHLRGEDLLAAIAPPTCVDPAVLRDTLVTLAGVTLRPVVQIASDDPPPLGARAAPAHIAAQIDHFPPLPLAALPDQPPPPVIRDLGPILCLPENEGPHLRIALWASDAHVPEGLRCYLPHLAASAQAMLQGKATCHHGAGAGLALGLRLLPAQLGDTLAALAAWFADPPVAAPRPIAPPLAAEIRLRAAMSPDWAQIGALLMQEVPPPTSQDLRALALALLPQVRLATSNLAAVDALARWREGWPLTPAPANVALAPLAPRHAVVLSEGALFTLGVGFDAQSLPQVPAALIMRALEAEYLWPRLRVMGGAYGIRATQAGRLLTMISLRDPQGLRSLDQMRAAQGWLAEHADAGMLHRAQLGVAALALKPRPLSERLADVAQTGALPLAPAMAEIRSATLDDLRQAAATLAAQDPVTLVAASGADLRAVGLG